MKSSVAWFQLKLKFVFLTALRIILVLPNPPVRLDSTFKQKTVEKEIVDGGLLIFPRTKGRMGILFVMFSQHWAERLHLCVIFQRGPP